jgi:hypothetical protein
MKDEGCPPFEIPSQLEYNILYELATGLILAVAIAEKVSL